MVVRDRTLVAKQVPAGPVTPNDLAYIMFPAGAGGTTFAFVAPFTPDNLFSDFLALLHDLAEWMKRPT